MLDPFPTFLTGFVFNTRIGAVGFESGFQGETVVPELIINSTAIDQSGNLIIETDALNTITLKVQFSPTLSQAFTDVTGITKQGEGGLTVLATSPTRQGDSGFFQVVHTGGD